MMKRVRAAMFAVAVGTCASPSAAQPNALDRTLQELARDQRFSGAVVVRTAEGRRFAKGYGMADPFTARRFTPDTPVDSGSLAKPFTAAAVLLLAREGKLDLDQPVSRYLPEFPHRATTVRHLLGHSAGLAGDEAQQSIVGKTNAQLLSQVGGREPAFPPGTAFSYCNLCFSTLAMVVERASGMSYLGYLQSRVGLPTGVTIRPARLADWRRRAIGYRRSPAGNLERADSYDNELFYGTANLSISAAQLADWGAQWWRPLLEPLSKAAEEPATINGRPSGLSWGNWYCAPGGSRCHYLGHHEGFHHMLYRDRDRRISVAMVSNNSLSGALQQRLQRALVAFAEGRRADALREIDAPLSGARVTPATYRLRSGEIVRVTGSGESLAVERRGLRYTAYPIGSGVRYVPGLDVYLTGMSRGRLHWLGLYEDQIGVRVGELR